MGDKKYRILLVEDCNRGMSKIVADFLFSDYHDLHINPVASIAEVEHRLEIAEFSAVLLAPNLPHYDGTSLVNYIKKISRGIPLVVSLNSDDRQLIDDVKRLGVARIFYDGNIDVAQMYNICRDYEAGRPEKPPVEPAAAAIAPVAPPVPGQQRTVSSIDLQQEIARHREALLKAKEESKSNREAAARAEEESARLREEAQSAKNEAESIKERIAELRRENAEKTEALAVNQQRVETIAHEVDESRVVCDKELAAANVERERLERTLQQVEAELDGRNNEAERVAAELTELRRTLEQSENERAEMHRRLEDSENKKNVSLRDAQEAINSLRRSEEENSLSRARIGDLEGRISDLIGERDKALDSSRIAGEYSLKMEKERDAAFGREEKISAAKRDVEKQAEVLTDKLGASGRMVDNLNAVVASLENRCEELEAGQAALIEAEHVGIQREREGREEAELELAAVRKALSELERIEEERARLEQLLKDGQTREQELFQAKTRELEEALTQERAVNCGLQEHQENLAKQLREVQNQLESRNKELGSVLSSEEELKAELGESRETVHLLENRITEYKNTLRELEEQYTAGMADADKERQRLEQRLAVFEEQNKALTAEKAEVMESYANKSEAVQQRLNEAEKMLKDCQWKLDNETSLKELALERVMELGAFEDQVGQLQLDIADKIKGIESRDAQVKALKEELAVLHEEIDRMRDRVQLENLEKDMALDKLRKECETLRQDYSTLQEQTVREKEVITGNAQELQVKFGSTCEELKSAQWELRERLEENKKLAARIEELQTEAEFLGDLHTEVDDLRAVLDKSERKAAALAAENDDLRERIEGYRELVTKVNELEMKAELAERVALEIDELNKAFMEEQIEHRRLDVELRKARERESHLAELTASNKELGWELMKARTLIGEFRAREEERAILGSVDGMAKVERYKSLLRDKERELEKTAAEKDQFIREQLQKVEELTELYEKAQSERLELLSRLGDKK